MIRKIEKFEEKHNVDFNTLLANFESGMILKDLVAQHSVPATPLRVFIISLGLDFIKSRRKESVDLFKYNMARESGEDVDLVKELTHEVESISKSSIKLHKTLVTTRDTNTFLRRQIRELSRTEQQFDTVIETFSKYLLDNEFHNTVAVTLSTHREPSATRGLCAIFSDEHFGDVVKAELEYGNVYNFDIAKQRLLYITEQLMNFPIQTEELDVFMLLDSVKGIIHGGDLTSEDGITNSVIKVIEVYSEVFTMLSAGYSEINVYVTLDNHGRLSEKPSTYNKQDNLSRLAVKMLEMLLNAKGIKNINFHFSKNDYIVTNINGANILAFHGDSQRGYSPTSIPQVSKVQDVSQAMFGVQSRHFVSGHQHKFIVAANQYKGKSIQNGTLVGTGEYGVTSGYSDIQPSQTIFVVEETGAIEVIREVMVGHIQC